MIFSSQVSTATLVSEVKKYVEQQVDVPISQQILVYKGKTLSGGNVGNSEMNKKRKKITEQLSVSAFASSYQYVTVLHR